MKYSIGYQLPDEFDSVPELCRDYNDFVSDVYFSWGAEPSGRFALCDSKDEQAVLNLQLEELKDIRQQGKTLTLLFNANCYGADAASVSFEKHITKLTEYLKAEVDISNITTTSPFVAETIKKNFGDSIKVRASVNMRIDSVCAMEQLADCFDGFYVRKECNRNFKKLEELHHWCESNGKTLHLLANSGCLNECAFQTFHDNIIAHQADGTDNGGANTGFPAPCHKFLAGISVEKALTRIMQANWIRPEDIGNYEALFSEVKLATRMHSRPRMVLAAYARGRFKGNLLDLTEPSYSGLLKGYVLDNRYIPSDWFKKATSCHKDCGNCNVCRDAVLMSTCKYEI